MLRLTCQGKHHWSVWLMTQLINVSAEAYCHVRFIVLCLDNLLFLLTFAWPNIGSLLDCRNAKDLHGNLWEANVRLVEMIYILSTWVRSAFVSRMGVVCVVWVCVWVWAWLYLPICICIACICAHTLPRSLHSNYKKGKNLIFEYI